MAINLNFGWAQAFSVEEGVQNNTQGTDATEYLEFCSKDLGLSVKFLKRTSFPKKLYQWH